MSPAMHQFLSLDLPAMLTGTLAVLTCALLGNFLLLRRQSLMGDAISHAVLPGLVAGFLITGSRGTIPMFLGAAAAGVATVVLVELVRRLGRLESGAAMGVVFSVLFAAGVLLIEQAAARGVDLDPDCVLNGQLERVFWFPPQTWGEVLSWRSLAQLPRELITLGAVTLITTLLIVLFFKELRISSFDPALSTSLGIHASVMHYGLMLVVAAAVVASFEAVGSILVIAMLVCPAATARLFADRLASQVWVSAGVAVLIGIGGYSAAVHVTSLWGESQSLSAAGMMTAVAGVLLTAAILVAPRHGVIARNLRRLATALAVSREDLLAGLYRSEEQGASSAGLAGVPGWIDRLALARARKRGEVARTDLSLTPRGRESALELIRAHRLWENYLVRSAQLRPDHVHAVATELEHITDRLMARKLAEEGRDPGLDPHGRPIPPPQV